MHIIQTPKAPNPRRVRIFLHEKGIAVPFENIGMMDGELKSPEFTAINPLRRVPVLVLDDGTAIAELIAICRYFEELQPEPTLFGRGPLEAATVEMWNRRVEFGLFGAVASVLRHLNPKMAKLEVPQVAAWGEANKAKVGEMLSLLDEQFARTRYIAGEHYSIADITALVAIDFMKPARIEKPASLANLARWYGEVSSRPSAQA